MDTAAPTPTVLARQHAYDYDTDADLLDPNSRCDGALVPLTATPQAVARHEQEYVEPVRKLRATLSDVLDADGNPDRAPTEALSMLKDAMDTFNVESSNWLG